MQQIAVELGDNSYDVLIKSGLLAHAGPLVSPHSRGGRMLVVTDSNVAQHVAPDFLAGLKSEWVEAVVHVLPAGEASKSWLQLAGLVDWLLANHVERSDHIIALGGGVVGDITGFAAHIVKRGCNFIQVPTTLLAQVDSSVGGKTAINTAAGKNLVGAFHQPSLVLIDPDVLQSLPRRELAAGFAEVVKYGLINDLDFFDYCDSNVHAFFDGDAAVRAYAIAHSVQSKAESRQP